MKRKRPVNQFEAKPGAIYQFDSPALQLEGIDLENGIIRGVSVITSGITARGHDLEVDKTTMVQMLECSKKKGGKIKTKWNHQSGADAMNGTLRNFRIEGSHLRADWHLLKKHPQYEHALELAVEMPESFGLSASFAGEPEVKNGKNYARCEDLISTDLVSDPAANPSGLFESKVDKAFSDMADNDDSKLDKLISMMEAQGAEIEELRAFNADLREQLEQDEDGDEELDDEGEFEDDDESEFEGEDDGEFEGEGEGSFAGVGGEVGAELSRLRNTVINLEARLERQDLEEARAIEDHAFSVINGKTELLIEELEALRVENQILIEFQEKVQANGGASVSLGSDPGLRRGATEFQKKVHEFKEGGLSAAEATRKAMNIPGIYNTHLQAIGSRQTNL